jgi:hypothetical protein
MSEGERYFNRLETLDGIATTELGDKGFRPRIVRVMRPHCTSCSFAEVPLAHAVSVRTREYEFQSQRIDADDKGAIVVRVYREREDRPVVTSEPAYLTKRGYAVLSPVFGVFPWTFSEDADSLAQVADAYNGLAMGTKEAPCRVAKVVVRVEED